MDEEAERANKKAKTEESEEEDDEDGYVMITNCDMEDKYRKIVNTWTDVQIVQEYDDLCKEYRDLYERVGEYPRSGRRNRIEEHFHYYKEAYDMEYNLDIKMEIVVNIADERGIPGDRSEGRKLCG